MDKIVRVIVLGNATNYQQVSNLTGCIPDISQYNQCFLCIEKFVGFHNTVVNQGLILRIDNMRDGCSNNGDNSIFNVSDIVDVFFGTPNIANTSRNYDCVNSIETWIPITWQTLTQFTVRLNGVINDASVVANPCTFVLSLKLKFVK